MVQYIYHRYSLRILPRFGTRIYSFNIHLLHQHPMTVTPKIRKTFTTSHITTSSSAAMRAMLTFGALLLLLCFGDVAAVASHNAAAPRSGSDRRALPTKTTFTRNNNTQKNPAVEKQVQNANKSVNLKHKDADNKEEIIPSILVGWLRLYRAIPTGLKIPFTKIDVSFTIASALFLACFDLLTAELLCSVMGWTKGSVDTRAVAGSLTTIFHGTILVFGLGTCLATQPYSPSGKMDDHPTWWQDAASSLIQLCTGYMLYDASVQVSTKK